MSEAVNEKLANLVNMTRQALASGILRKKVRIVRDAEQEEALQFARKVWEVIDGAGSTRVDSAVRPGSVGMMGSCLIFNCTTERDQFFKGLGVHCDF